MINLELHTFTTLLYCRFFYIKYYFEKNIGNIFGNKNYMLKVLRPIGLIVFYFLLGSVSRSYWLVVKIYLINKLCGAYIKPIYQ